MKRIYFIIIISVLTILIRPSFSQQISALDDNDRSQELIKSSISMGNTTFAMNFNFNNGSSVVFKGVMMRTISSNIFWVKNARISTSENKALVDLSRKVLVNGFPFVSQIAAVNGYIVEFPADNSLSKNIIIAIAGSNGEKISDDLLINLDDIK